MVRKFNIQNKENVDYWIKFGLKSLKDLESNTIIRSKLPFYRTSCVNKEKFLSLIIYSNLCLLIKQQQQPVLSNRKPHYLPVYKYEDRTNTCPQSIKIKHLNTT